MLGGNIFAAKDYVRLHTLWELLELRVRGKEGNIINIIYMPAHVYVYAYATIEYVHILADLVDQPNSLVVLLLRSHGLPSMKERLRETCKVAASARI